MERKFIPKYDIKIRGGKIITEWRYGAHPTLHAIPQTLPQINQKSHNTGKKQSTISKGAEAMPDKKGGGTLWGDKNTKPIKQPLPSIRRKSTDSVSEEKDFQITETQEIALKKDVRKAMQELKDKDIKGILPSLRALDSGRGGRLWIDQVKIVLQTHKIAMSESGYRNLFKKFGELQKLQHVVRYEEMMRFLSKLYSEAAALPAKKTSTPPAAGFSNGPSRLSTENSGAALSLSNRSYHSNYSNSYQVSPGVHQNQRILHMRNKVMFQDRDEAKLILDIERELQDQPVNMTDLRNIMYYLDRDRNNFLNATQVQDAFQRCGIYLSTEVFSRLLLATDRTGGGMYQIETLINYLTRARPETHYHLALGMNHNPRRVRAPVLPALMNQPAYHVPYTQPQTFDSQADYLSEYDEQSFPYDSYLDPRTESEQFDASRWSSDFQNLVQALQQADEDKTGYLTQSEAARIANNYSLVYNLSISTSTLNTALEKALDKKLKEINIDHFAVCLEQAHLQEIMDH